MSIEQNWNDMNTVGDADFENLLASAQLSKLQSNGTLQKIRKNLRLNIYWGAVVCLLYVVIICRYPLWQVQAALGIVLAFSLWAIYSAWVEYKKLGPDISAANSLLDELKRHHRSLQKWIAIQKRVALFIYPISAAGGFMLGGFIGSGKPVAVFMSKPIVVIILLAVIAILVPLCHLLAKWMFKLSFGKCLDKLGQNIRELEAEK